ncbi:hypothetical protein GGE65_007277 [Skermanella aerolata]|uniref:hypothetical protein n=1 Tax=Skermanella aerolata TaxID=393310 RepID=UPI003D1B8BD9
MGKNIKLKQFWCPILAQIVVLLFSGSATAVELKAQKEALDMIADFADRMCARIDMEGSTQNLELTGKAKAELNTLLKKLAGLGLEGAVKYQEYEWQGPLQKDIANLLATSTQCKLDIWRDLKERVLFQEKPEPNPEILSTGVQNFTVINENDYSLRLVVSYIYSGSHGDNAWIGALPERYGMVDPFFVYSYGGPLSKGTGKTIVSITANRNLPASIETDVLHFDLFFKDPGNRPPHKIFLSTTLPFKKTWKNPLK